MIDWEGLDKIGISKATLEQQGLLDSMLRGYKTNKLVPLTLNIPGVLTAKLDARLSLIPQENGQVGAGRSRYTQGTATGTPLFRI